jgi:hypothetical protein
MPLASKMLLQFAAQDIGQLTDIDASVRQPLPRPVNAAAADRLATRKRTLVTRAPPVPSLNDMDATPTL